MIERQKFDTLSKRPALRGRDKARLLLSALF